MYKIKSTNKNIKMPKNIPNPTKVAKAVNFKFDSPLDLNKTRHSGICKCNTRGKVSYDSLRKKKFCRNEECQYYQVSKRIDRDEMAMIIEEKECELINLNGRGVTAIIEFKCTCGFTQSCSWLQFYNKKWCAYFKCSHYRRLKNLTTDLITKWIEYEDYKVPEDFSYISKYQAYYKNKYNLLCPKKHIFTSSIQMWVDGARCLTCEGNGRTLSYFELKKFYENEKCTLLLEEDEYIGNYTDNILPYKCPKSHIIQNLTKNQFNNRLTQDLGPCALCNKQHLKNNYNVEHPMQIPEIISLQQRSDKYRKSYIFPDGDEICIHGYEDRALDILLEKYKKDEIWNEMEDKPEIWYFNPNKNKKCRYFTDFYIPKDNLMVEVKSTYWYKRQKEINLAKFAACVKSGYNLKVYIFDEKTLVNVQKYRPGSEFLFE